MTENAYWCIECEGWHWRDSKIGKRHVVFEVDEPLWLPEEELVAWRKLHSSDKTGETT